MSIWEIVMIVLGVILVCYLCNYCCGSKNRQGRILEAPVVITTTTTSAGYGVDPIPVGGIQPAPYPPAIPMPAQANPPYPTSYPASQPIPQQGQISYPPAPGFQPHAVPYPTVPPPPSSYPTSQNPPSYDQVVGEGKQAPYNPHYMGN